MCRKFVHEDGTIKKPRSVANFRGTVKYAPVSCHAGRELCRQDDCETWLYMVVELTKGSLPWKNLQDIQAVGNEKRAVRTTGEVGIKRMFGGCPREYIDILRVIDGGKFFEEPDYSRMYGLLRKAMASTGAREFPYDWEEWLTAKMKKEQEEGKQGRKEDKDKKEDKPAEKTDPKAKEKKPEDKDKKEEKANPKPEEKDDKKEETKPKKPSDAKKKDDKEKKEEAKKNSDEDDDKKPDPGEDSA